MTSEHLRAALTRKPFVPIVPKTTHDREYRVDHPELVSFSPGGRTINLWVTGNAGMWIDVPTIESIHVLSNGHSKPRRRSA